jgi:hypothetical protein
VNATAAREMTEGVADGLESLARLRGAFATAADAPLSSIPDDLLQDTRRALALLGPEAWRALAAVDFELVERARKRPRAVGRPDLGGGHARRVGGLARSLGTRRLEMMRNRDAHVLSRLSLPGTGRAVLVGDILQRADFYHAALRWPRPQEVITDWAERTARGETVTPAGPSRRPLTLAPLTPPAQHGEDCINCLAAAHIRRTLETFRAVIIPDVPAPIWTARLYLDWLDDLNESLSDLEGHAPARASS